MELKNVNNLSEQLLLAVKMKESTDELVSKLEHFPFLTLQQELQNDEFKKAFWINIYNAFFQILRVKKNLKQPEIYKAKQIIIAGMKLSLDDVEHGILRHFRYKYSLGYLPNIFAPKFIKNLAVNSIDYRIHFALNCGAKSCPPIAFYTANKIDKQLETATLSFLETETDVDQKNKKIYITKLFLWFLKDFGGKAGVQSILSEKLKIDLKGFKIIYKEYSWEDDLHNFNEV